MLKNPCWKILVQKSLLQNPCWKILVGQSLLKNPCWKSLLEILVEKSKDFSTRIFQQGITTRIYNNDLQQGFLMFQQKCSNKNVPTKSLFNQKFVQQGCSNKSCQQGFFNKEFPTRIFQQGFFNKDFLSLLTNPCSKNPFWKSLFKNPGSNKSCSKILVAKSLFQQSLLEILVEKSKDFSTRIFQQECSIKNVTTRICNKDF